MSEVIDVLKNLDQRERMILMMTMVEQELEVMLLEDWEGIVLEMRSLAMLYNAIPSSSIPLEDFERFISRFEETRKIKKKFDSKDNILKMAEENLREHGLL